MIWHDKSIIIAINITNQQSYESPARSFRFVSEATLNTLRHRTEASSWSPSEGQRTEQERPSLGTLCPHASLRTSKTLAAFCGPWPEPGEMLAGGSTRPSQFCFLKNALQSQIGFQGDDGREEHEKG